MDFDSDEVYQKLSNYKIPLKTASSCKDSGDIGWSDEQQSIVTSEEIFSSPLLNSELGQEFSTSHIEYSRRQQSFGTEQNNVVGRKRKRDESDKKPMFFGRDISYPAELNALIQPLYCNLCNAHLNSIITAKVHYESKSHDKRITSWLAEWSLKSGEPIPQVKRFVKDGRSGPDAFHCEACDLSLTSVQHASQHYNGKKHKMVVARKSDPSGSGFYSNDGKWIRQAAKPTKEVGTRFGIGDSFTKLEEAITPVGSPESTSQDPTKYCSICDISVTSTQQMEMHLKGTKHAKRLKQQGLDPPPNSGVSILECLQQPQSNDISIYRTPSGNYYCKICNSTMSEPAVFQQHLISKKHIKNVKLL